LGIDIDTDVQSCVPIISTLMKAVRNIKQVQQDQIQYKKQMNVVIK